MNRLLSHSPKPADVSPSQLEADWPSPGEVATEIALILAVHLTVALVVSVALWAMGIA
jgi:hypothetical protein